MKTKKNVPVYQSFELLSELAQPVLPQLYHFDHVLVFFDLDFDFLLFDFFFDQLFDLDFDHVFSLAILTFEFNLFVLKLVVAVSTISTVVLGYGSFVVVKFDASQYASIDSLSSHVWLYICLYLMICQKRRQYNSKYFKTQTNKQINTYTFEKNRNKTK